MVSITWGEKHLINKPLILTTWKHPSTGMSMEVTRKSLKLTASGFPPENGWLEYFFVSSLGFGLFSHTTLANTGV